MFKLQKVDFFTWPVTINVPTGQDGTFTKRTFRVKFKLKTQSEMDAAVEQLKANDVDILKDLLVGWPDGEIQDPDGNNLAYSEDIRDQLIDIPYVRTGLLEAYFKAANGQKAKQGNS